MHGPWTAARWPRRPRPIRRRGCRAITLITLRGRRREGNDPADGRVQIMAKTGTRLIAIMLGRLRMNVDDCIRDYERLGDRVFGHGRWFHLRSFPPAPREKYNHKVLEHVVRDVVERRVPYVATFPGGRNFGFDENRCRTYVTGPGRGSDELTGSSVVLSYQQGTGGVESTYLFRTYKNLHRSADPQEKLLDRNPGLAHDIPIWEVARATSAAPSYFKEHKIGGRKYLDGGFGANNPCVEIYDEVRKMNNNSESCANVILSIGTGKNTKIARFTSGTTLRRYYNYLNFARKWASDSEKTHSDMLKKHVHSGSKFHYMRLNVEEGLGDMKLDEWKVRGQLRVSIGRCIGRIRASKPRPPKNGEPDAADGPPDGDAHAEKANILSAPPRERGGVDPRIPAWFRPKNETLETITARTEAYLARPDVQGQIEECAQLLVDCRRARARTDPPRWEKACFGAWFQCNIERCPRGEKEYENRPALKRHLLSKHKDQFTTDAGLQDQDRLEKALDECKIIVH